MVEIISTYWDACDDLSKELLQFAAQSLDVDFQTLFSAFEAPLTNMTLLRYPPTAGEAEFGYTEDEENVAEVMGEEEMQGEVAVAGFGGSEFAEI